MRVYRITNNNADGGFEAKTSRIAQKESEAQHLIGPKIDQEQHYRHLSSNGIRTVCRLAAFAPAR